MRKSIAMPIVALILAAAILLAGYNLLGGVRAAREEAELTAKMQPDGWSWLLGTRYQSRRHGLCTHLVAVWRLHR